MVEPSHKLKAENKTSVLLDSLKIDSASDYCGYCKGNRQSLDQLETKLLNYRISFTSNKLRADDLDALFDCGFVRGGNYIYKRNA